MISKVFAAAAMLLIAQTGLSFANENQLSPGAEYGEGRLQHLTRDARQPAFEHRQVAEPGSAAHSAHASDLGAYAPAGEQPEATVR